MTRSVYPSFGEMSSWHLVPNAPDGPLDGRAERVASIWQESRNRLAPKWPVRPILLKALTLELTVAFADEGRRPPDGLLRALAGLLELPDAFLDDPVSLFQGDDGRGAKLVDPRARETAIRIESEHWRRFGEAASLNGLATAIQRELNIERKPSRSTLRRWRLDPDYRLSIAALGMVADSN